MKRAAFLVAIFVTASPATAAGAEITIEEIGRMHEEAKGSIRTGRVSFTLERNWRPSFIEQVQQNRLRGLPESELEKRLEIETLRTNGTFEVDYVFDLDSGLHKERVTDGRDFDKLVEGGAVSRDLRQYLSKVTVRSFALAPAKYGIPAGTVKTYEADWNALTITQSDFPESPLCRPGHKLPWGFVQYNPPDPDWDVSLEARADDPNLLVARVSKKDGTRGAEAVLDSSFGYRIAQWRLFRDGRLEAESRARYRKIGDHAFPVSFEETFYGGEGEILMQEKFTFTFAELNVEIDPSEFEIEAPADATVREGVEFWETRPQVVRAD